MCKKRRRDRVRGHQGHARIHEFLLRIEDVERGSLPDPRLFADNVERNFGGVHLRRGCLDLRFGGVQLSELCTDRSPSLIAVTSRSSRLLTKGFLVLANGGIFSAALVNRDRESSQNGEVRCLRFCGIVS